MAIRFIHTADWQLGLRVRYIPGDAGAVVRDARLRTIRRIGRVAREEGAAFVVVAGDVFEHHGLKPATVRKSLDAMGEMGVPVWLLPGNHDPYTPESIYRSDLWRRECPPDVHVLGSTEPVEAADGVYLLPCPLLDRHVIEDPAEHLDADFGPRGAIRLGVAHGGILEILRGMAGAEADGADGYDPANAIARDTAARAELDYLALGDWHGLLQVDERTWYPGTPEATRFKERDPGRVLLVDIDGPGAPPRVEARRVSTLTWTRHEATVDSAEDVDALAGFVDGLPDKADTLLELFVSGTVDLALRDALDRRVIEIARDRLRWLRLRDDALHTFLTEDDLRSIATDGWVREVVDRLAGRREDEEAGAALRLLYRLHREVIS